MTAHQYLLSFSVSSESQLWNIFNFERGEEITIVIFPMKRRSLIKKKMKIVAVRNILARKFKFILASY